MSTLEIAQIGIPIPARAVGSHRSLSVGSVHVLSNPLRALKLIFALAVAAFMIGGAADAHSRHHGRHHHHQHYHHSHHHAGMAHHKVFHHRKHRRHYQMNFHGKYTVGNISGVGGARFVRGRLICALNVSRWLKVHGFRSPMSPSSKAFLAYAPVARANVRYGDVHFNYRRGGGHVMVALGNGLCLNPSSRHQAWVTKACPAGGKFVRTGA